MSRQVDPRWKVHSRHLEVQRQPWLEVFRETIELPDGRLVDDFYSVDMQDFVVVVAITRAGDVVVEKLYRHGAGSVTWSLPAGYVNVGESPLDAGIRELREETGYEAAAWTSLGRFIVDGNRGCGWCNCFLATGAEIVVEPNSNDLADAHVSTMPLERLSELLAVGEVAELASAAALGLASLRLASKSANGN